MTDSPALQASKDLDEATLKANRERDDEERRRAEKSGKAKKKG
jgi:hypothetical protein